MTGASERNHDILIVDDNPDTLVSLAPAFHERGWRFVAATSGRSGFHRAQVLQPNLILLDVLMPGMDGRTTCRLLKASPRTRDIPIIFLTSACTPEDRVLGFECGGADYVAKPFLVAEVVARIHVHLQLSLCGDATDEHSDPMPLLSREQATLQAAMRFIRAHLADLQSLDEIAHQVGTYDKKLSAIFRRQLGMTVFAWVREERLRLAREWLRNSDMNMVDISAQVGFHSASSFSTAFRKRMGVTPSQYRTNLQQIMDSSAALS